MGSEVKDITDDLPFEIPDNWVWCRLNDIIILISGTDLSPDKYNSNNKGIPYITGASNFINSILNINRWTEHPTTISDKGDLLITCKGTIGEMAYNNVGVIHIARQVMAIRSLYHFVSYIRILLETYITSLKKAAKSMIPGISRQDILQCYFPLPPLAEQVRIVAEIEKFEPLIAEYNKLEQQATKLDEEIYDKLKKSILQYAIQGKLVPQDPNDEPASVLLERIRAEKRAKLGKKYVDSYIYKGDDNCYYEKVGETVTNISDEIPFDLPENWAWCRLQMICLYIHRGKSPTYGTERILPIIAQKCNQWSGIQTQKCLFADRATIKKYTEEQYLCVGDIIINSTGTGTVGRTGYVDDTLFKEYPKFVADSHVTVVRPLEHIDSKYIYLFLKSPVIQTDIEAKCSGSTNQIELATKTIQSYLIPLPPVAEQYRITSMFFALEARLKDEV